MMWNILLFLFQEGYREVVAQSINEYDDSFIKLLWMPAARLWCAQCYI
jgi:hypothetical protein